MTILFAPLAVFVIGVLVYALAGYGKVQEAGRAGLWIGLLWLAYGLGHGKGFGSIFAPPVVFVVGLLVWALSANAKVAEIGKAGMWAGLLWLTYGLADIRL